MDGRCRPKRVEWRNAVAQLSAVFVPVYRTFQPFFSLIRVRGLRDVPSTNAIPARHYAQPTSLDIASMFKLRHKNYFSDI